jgi:hypothetical protein
VGLPLAFIWSQSAKKNNEPPALVRVAQAASYIAAGALVTQFFWPYVMLYLM